jgi:hypothetical protein
LQRPGAAVQFLRNQVSKMQERYNGWAIDFTKNVHMYTHSLKAEKNGQIYDVPCEDTPFGYVGIWPLGLHLDAPLLQDLLRGLGDWAGQANIIYRLYSTGTDYQTNGQ